MERLNPIEPFFLGHVAMFAGDPSEKWFCIHLTGIPKYFFAVSCSKMASGHTM